MIGVNPYLFLVTPPSGTISVANGYFGTSLSNVTSLYASLEKDVTAIETLAGVGTPGVLSIGISYINGSFALAETINVDTTSPSTFWTDILNWCYPNNLYGITYDVITNHYLVDDPDIPTYICINI